jgi:hypothetical protein
MTKDKNNGNMKHRMSKKVFICYETTTGLDYAKHLKEALEKTDRSAFVADEDIKKGEAWQEVIDEAIKASKYFIVIVTSPALDSKEVEREITLADRLLSLKGNIIPCKEKSVYRSWLSKLPIINELQQINFESKEELARTVISEILGRETAKITFESAPSGADVYINGRKVGRT